MLAFGKWLYEKYNRPPKTYEEEFERIRAKYERRYNEIGESTDEEGEEGEHKKLVNIAPNQLFERHGMNVNYEKTNNTFYSESDEDYSISFSIYEQVSSPN